MSEPRWVLEVLGGEARAVELPASGTLVLGSHKERASFVLEGQGVDEAHCAIGRTKEGDWAVKDLGSRYGTMLNGQRVSAARLKLGDQLVLGSRRLEVKAQSPVATVGSARPAEAPKRIAGYRIERLIGKGAMGAVYLAVQESLRRPVALKVLPPKLAADRDFVLRFQAEARAAAALSHPNVVVVYDVGEESGQHYLSMEFMAGGSLEQKLAAGGPLPWKAVLSVLNDAAAGLAYAESKGIVHRDIKPANLMYSGTGTVKIADLGLATTIEQEAIEADGVPGGARKVFGTPHFIAPEQARGQAVDHRSDLYALGATAYRLLSGKTPFEGATTREILRALQSETPRPLRELVPDLPGELAAVIERLMEKAPEARYPTAEALRRECERLRLVAEHGPAPEVRSGSRWQLVLGLGLLVVVGGASAAWFLLQREEPVAQPTQEPELVAAPDEPLDPDFFGEPEGNAQNAPDEEQALRAREREAGAALREVPTFLAGPERLAALERIVAQYPGTAAAGAAADEIAALRSLPPGRAGGLGPTLEESVAELEGELATLAADGSALPAVLRAIEDFRPPPELAQEFEARRAALARKAIAAEEADLRAAFARATELALGGQFDELRAHLAALEPRFAGLADLPGDPALLAPLTALGSELAERRARVDEEERFYRENAERARRRALGEALGPGSGLLAELGALDLDALEQRLARLPAELRALAPCPMLAAEAALARQALAALQREFAGGGWRRKALVDPRTKKVREVRDVRPEGLVFDKDGALDPLSWREVRSDPEWWNQLFQARLAREWEPAEARAIAALLHLVGATRGAELGREMIDPGGRATLQPAELEALGAVFAPALGWAAGEEAVLLAEQELAQRLARALGAAQGRAWTAAAAELELVLRAREVSLLACLLSDGADWRSAPPAGAASPR